MKPFRAELKDVPRIMACARLFTAELPDCHLDEAFYLSFWRQTLLHDQGVIFLLETEAHEIAGGIGAVIVMDVLTGRNIAIEKFWYVKPEHRGGSGSIRLLQALEEWARARGCYHLGMIYMEASMPEQMKGFYERRGYELLETVYRKKL